MKTAVCFTLVFLAVAPSVRSQDSSVSLPDLLQGVQQWTLDNLDTNLLNAVPEVDDKGVRDFLRQLQTRFQGDYVVDLAALRQTAQAVLPLLEASEETQPYAAWLKAQLPYLKVADEIQVSIPPPATTNPVPKVMPNLPPQREREVWVKEVSSEPWPAGAKKICDGVKAGLRREKSAAGTCLGGRGGVILRPARPKSGGRGGIIPVDAGDGQAFWFVHLAV